MVSINLDFCCSFSEDEKCLTAGHYCFSRTHIFLRKSMSAWFAFSTDTRRCLFLPESSEKSLMSKSQICNELEAEKTRKNCMNIMYVIVVVIFVWVFCRLGGSKWRTKVM